MSKDDVEAGSADLDVVVSDEEADRIFDEEMSKGDAPEGGGTDEGNGGSGKEKEAPAGTEKKAAEEQSDKGKDEEELLRGFGYDPATMKPEERTALVPHFKNVKERVDKQLAEARAEADRLKSEKQFYGTQNKKISDDLKKVKAELDRLNANPALRASAWQEKLASLDRSKLTEGQRRLLEDADMMGIMGLLLDSPVTAKSTVSSSEQADDFEDPVMREQVGSAWPEYRDTYGSPDFDAWAKTKNQSGILELAKTPEGNARIMSSYHAERALANAPYIHEYVLGQPDQQAALSSVLGAKTKAEYDRAWGELRANAIKATNQQVEKLYPAFEKDMASKEYAEWFKEQDQAEQSRGAGMAGVKGIVAHVGAFRAYQAAKAAAADDQKELDRKKAATGGVGKIGSGSAPLDDDVDYLSMSDEEFETRKSAALSGQGR